MVNNQGLMLKYLQLQASIANSTLLIQDFEEMRRDHGFGQALYHHQLSKSVQSIQFAINNKFFLEETGSEILEKYINNIAKQRVIDHFHLLYNQAFVTACTAYEIFEIQILKDVMNWNPQLIQQKKELLLPILNRYGKNNLENIDSNLILEVFDRMRRNDKVSIFENLGILIPKLNYFESGKYYDVKDKLKEIFDLRNNFVHGRGSAVNNFEDLENYTMELKRIAMCIFMREAISYGFIELNDYASN